MKRFLVDSSMINSIGYDELTSTLEVEFNDGVVWDYPGVPEHLWSSFQSAESKGKFFHRFIKKQYTPTGYRVN